MLNKMSSGRFCKPVDGKGKGMKGRGMKGCEWGGLRGGSRRSGTSGLRG